MKLDRSNKKDNISIKWKLFGYLAIIVATMLVLLWTFQSFLLQDFYKLIQTQQIKAAAEMIRKNIDNPDLQELVTHFGRRANMSIRITDRLGNNRFSTDFMPENQISRLSNDQLEELYQQALKNGGTYLKILVPEAPPSKEESDRKHFIGSPPSRRGMESLIYTRNATRSDGTEVVILLNTFITPVDAVVDTLRVQLLIVTCILLGLSVLLALLISHRVSKPIININETAKELAKGNYDITFQGHGYKEIAELNKTLNFSAQELGKVDGLRRELIANISHDLRTPLTMIGGYAEVMRDLPGENTPENLQVIIDETARLNNLVNDVLDISKLQSGTQALVKQDFNLTKTIAQILKRYSKFIEQGGYTIRFIASSEAIVNADELRISQVLYNLINNAITYTGEDKTVTICQSVGEGRVKIEVIDTGEGIAQEKLDLIWDRYYKVDREHKRGAIGSGLGLSIVKSILTMHDARYGVISTPGQGSIFWFALDATESED